MPTSDPIILIPGPDPEPISGNANPGKKVEDYTLPELMQRIYDLTIELNRLKNHRKKLRSAEKGNKISKYREDLKKYLQEKGSPQCYKKLSIILHIPKGSMWYALRHDWFRQDKTNVYLKEHFKEPDSRFT